MTHDTKTNVGPTRVFSARHNKQNYAEISQAERGNYSSTKERLARKRDPTRSTTGRRNPDSCLLPASTAALKKIPISGECRSFCLCSLDPRKKLLTPSRQRNTTRTSQHTTRTQVTQRSALFRDPKTCAVQWQKNQRNKKCTPLVLVAPHS